MENEAFDTVNEYFRHLGKISQELDREEISRLWKLAKKGDTSIFIRPGYQYQMVDALITNFHLPGSTLLMLVSALYDREHMLEVYRTAVEEEYRFFSFGDAMFIQ